MSQPEMTERDLLLYIKQMVEEAGTQKQIANQLQISEQYLDDILSRRRKAGKRVLAALGIRQVKRFVFTERC